MMTHVEKPQTEEGRTGGRGSALAVQAVDRVLRMLQAFDADRREIGVNDFTQLLGVHKSTASRLASTLVGRGFLEQSVRTRRFLLGPEVGRLGLLAMGHRDLVALAREVMDRLALDTRETVNLAVLEGNSVVNIAQTDGPHIMGVGNWAGQRTALHCTSNGKGLLAFCEIPIAPQRLEKFTPQTLTNSRELKKHLEETRVRGWATNISELEEGLHAVAVPVFDGAGRCLAALSISGPSYRMPPARLPQLAAQARRRRRKSLLSWRAVSSDFANPPTEPKWSVVIYGANGKTEAGLISPDGAYAVHKAPVGDVKMAVIVSNPSPKTPSGMTLSPGAKKRPPRPLPPPPDLPAIKFVPIPDLYKEPDQSGLNFT